MNTRLLLLVALAAVVVLPASAGAGNPSLTQLKVGDAIDVLNTRVACYAINSNGKDGIACVLVDAKGLLANSYGVGLAVDGTAVVNKIDAKGNSQRIWKKRLPASRAARTGHTYHMKAGQGFGLPTPDGTILGCQILNVTSTSVGPLYRGIKVSCWFATASKAVPNRYGISISDKMIGIFKVTPQGTMSTWGYVKQQPK